MDNYVTACLEDLAMKKVKVGGSGASVPCPCPACGGAKVSKYIRLKHMRLYVRRVEKTNETSAASPKHELVSGCVGAGHILR